MKTAIMPAQVTTKEDKITASLSLTQIMLLIMPVFSSAIIIVLLPPWLKLNPLKIFVAVLLALPPLLLALRVRGWLVLSWLILGCHYYRRPRRYCATVNSNSSCNCYRAQDEQEMEETKKSVTIERIATQIPDPERLVIINGFLAGRGTSYRLSKEGKLSVLFNKR